MPEAAWENPSRVTACEQDEARLLALNHWLTQHQYCLCRLLWSALTADFLLYVAIRFPMCSLMASYRNDTALFRPSQSLGHRRGRPFSKDRIT